MSRNSICEGFRYFLSWLHYDSWVINAMFICGFQRPVLTDFIFDIISTVLILFPTSQHSSWNEICPYFSSNFRPKSWCLYTESSNMFCAFQWFSNKSLFSIFIIISCSSIIDIISIFPQNSIFNFPE